MIYLIGGAARVGKSTLCQQFSERRGFGWISTDILYDMLRVKGEDGMMNEWNAAPEAIEAMADWFYPYLQRFIWGISKLAANYTIEGVHFLPRHVTKLSIDYQVHAVFVGSSQMTLEKLDRYPGKTRGYSELSKTLRRRIAGDVPTWSQFIHDESQRFGYNYIDLGRRFSQQLEKAEKMLASQELTG